MGQQPPAPPSPGQQGEPAPAPRRAVQLKPIHDVHIDELLELVVAHNASDLHLAVGIPPVIRVDGKLRKTKYESIDPQVSQRIIYDILLDEQIERFETELELDCAYQLQKLARFRVNVFKDRGTIAAAMRLIPTKIPTIDELGLPAVVQDLGRRPRGYDAISRPASSPKAYVRMLLKCPRSGERKLCLTMLRSVLRTWAPLSR